MDLYKTSGASPPPLSIAHITLNTGDVAMVPHTFLTDHAELHDRFQEIIRVGSGCFLNVPHLSCEVSVLGADAAALTIYYASMPVVFGIVCCDANESQRSCPKFS